ncbi:hypothetical protein [Actinacidiphila acididurans]|uniref:Thioredoxin family protein n=1 Tax=Actinacidiphila acididurans TaxID=2784346 RepID=A0ABS2TIR4_9ACTN|nr:hypothetical protein [Actinacidiphila acididurans]MBM9503239.1 hypothetical protein [Actinacidiphila acididurans]
MDVELLYFEDCANRREAERRLEQALAATGRAGTKVVLRLVASDEQARALRFPGSPTIRVDGRDLFPPEGPAPAENLARAGSPATARGPLPYRDLLAPAEPFGLTCRVYATPDGPAGAPTVDQLVRALGGGER